MNDKPASHRIRVLPIWAGLALTLALLSLAGLLTAAAAASPTSARLPQPLPLRAEGNYGGNLRFALTEPEGLDPAAPVTNTSDYAMLGQIFEGLTAWDDSLAAVPAIALSWASADAQHWTFQLRHGVRFHNGRLLTAQDVLYSWQRVAVAGNDWYGYTVGPLLQSYTAVGTDTVQVTLSEPFAAFPTLLALPFMSVVPSETVGTIVTQPVGSGPFRFESWTAGDSLVVSHYDAYYGGRPYLDSVTYRFYADEAAMYDDYLLGNLDLSPVPAERITEVIGSPNAVWINGLGLSYYGMKVDMPPFDDVRVRRALNYALDRPSIVEIAAAERGYLVPAEGPVPPGMQGYDPPVPDYTYNPTMALELLAQAGWTDTDGDGVLDDGQGTDLSIELWYNPRHTTALVAGALAGAFGDIGGSGLGATVAISTTDWADYLANLDSYPMFSLGWGADYPDPYNFLHPFFHSAEDSNYTHYSNPQVDAWLAESRSALDLAARQGIYQQIEAQVQDDAPFISLYHPNTVVQGHYVGIAYIKGENVLGLVIGWGPQTVAMEDVQLFFHTHDVQPQSILYPKDNVLIDPITPTVKVRNAGASPETAVPVRCRVISGSTEIYSQTLVVDSLSPFATQVVAFPAWTPPAAGYYAFEVATLLPGDENPANDVETVVVGVTDVAFYDLYSRDNPTDDGSIPTAEWWQSPDILVRNQDDNVRQHQDPILGLTNTVYVQVRNIGNDTIADGYVDLYWHEPATAILCGGWALINPAPVPVGTLAPGQSKWVETPWTPPIEGHTCLFSRLWSGDDPVTAECDVPWDNNIAQRNVEVVNLGGGGQQMALNTGQAAVQFEVANLRDLPAAADLIVERGTFPPTGTLVLELSRDLFSRWQAAGGAVQGGAAIPGTSRIEVTDPVSATVLGLPLGVREMQRVRLEMQGPLGVEFLLHVSQRTEDNLVGGMTYHTTTLWQVYLPLVVRDQ